ncbi:MAG: tape measure protein [Candidatus Sabulitectum sp.]|nr:tape measure protein [Candidatus Sabulitectum sp.]
MAEQDIARLGLEVDSRDIRVATRRLDKMERQAGQTERATIRLKSGATGLASAFGALAVAAASLVILKQITNDGVAMQKMMNTLNVATGDATNSMAFLRAEAERLGLDLETSAESFGKIAAAARGTALEGEEVRRIFTAVATASTAMGLSADQTKGALRALEQMISKGNVQAEELRGQLGERLPGAFQLAAKAMGVTTKELNKMLEQGEVLATDLLPKLATVLIDDFGAGAQTASGQAQAQFNRLSTAIFELNAAVANSGVLQAIADLAGLLADAAQGAATFINVLSESEDDQLALAIRISDINEELQELAGGPLKGRIARLTKEMERLIAVRNAMLVAPTGAADTGDVEDEVNKERVKLEKMLDAWNVYRVERGILVGAIGEDDEAQAVAQEAIRFARAQADAEKKREQMLANTELENIERMQLISEFNIIEQGLAQEHEDILAAIRKRAEEQRIKAMSDAERLIHAVRESDVSSALGSAAKLTAGLAKHNRAAFEANKAFATGQVLVDGVVAVQKAASAFPFPFNVPGILAETLGAAGRLAAVRSATFGGGGSIPTSQGGSAGGVPSQQVPQAPPSEISPTAPGTEGRDINIKLIGDPSLVDDGTLERFGERLSPILSEMSDSNINMAVRT